MAQFFRDAQGVPHLRADDVLDLARAQGRVTAHDRAWQLEWQRRRATGTTAEAVGEPGVAWDVLARRTRVEETARRAHDALSEPTREFVAAYVAGVNQGLDDLDGDVVELRGLDLEAAAWEPWTPLAVFWTQHLLFANVGTALWRRWARAVLGDDARLLTHEGPASAGSNAWAVGGGRTASGAPLVGGDPHRYLESPGVYQQVRLACVGPEPADRFDVAGFAFPGVPGVQHFAHAGTVAWAITNGVADTQDVLDEEQPWQVTEQHTEGVAVRGGAPVEVDVVRTARGVLFHTWEGPDGEQRGLSLRDTATELGDLGFEALLPLLRARTAEDVERALDSWVVPVNNVIVADGADSGGTVRYRLAGRVPVRAGDGGAGWSGWLDPMPRTEVPTDGLVVSANERRGPESAAVGTEFAPPYRADRIRELLTGRDGLTAADFAAVHDDAHLATVAVLRQLVPGVFDDFDGHMRVDSAEAGRFAAWRSALVRRIVAESPFASFLDPADRAPEHRYSPVFATSLDLVARVALALPALVREHEAGRPPFGLDLPGLAARALDDVARSTGTWGQTHVVTPLHALGEGPWDVPALPVSGDADCVRCTGSYPGTTDACFRGSVARYVWDLADREAGGWVVPTGAHADPRSPHHHDQLEAWVAGALVPIVGDWQRLEDRGSL